MQKLSGICISYETVEVSLTFFPSIVLCVLKSERLVNLVHISSEAVHQSDLGSDHWDV